MPADEKPELPIPHPDVLRVDAQPAAGALPDRTQVHVVGIPQGGQVDVTADCFPASYPFTKGVSLRNDGLAYGEIMLEEYACYAKGTFTEPPAARSIRTRTARTYPPIATVDLNRLPTRDSLHATKATAATATEAQAQSIAPWREPTFGDGGKDA